MTVGEIRKEIEKIFPVGPETPYRLSVTGEPYVTFKYDRIMEEGEGLDIESLPTSKDSACKIFLESFIRQFGKKRNGMKLYWRIYPQLREIDSCERNGKQVKIKLRFFVRSRFLISNNPETPKRNESIKIL